MRRTTTLLTAASAAVVVAVSWLCGAWSGRPTEVLAEGRFHQVAHKGGGRAVVARLGSRGTVVRLVDFETSFRPDLEVLLVAAPDALENETVKRSDRVSLGPLVESVSDYPVPDDVDVSRFGCVAVWSRKYDVNFTTAPLAWRDGRQRPAEPGDGQR